MPRPATSGRKQYAVLWMFVRFDNHGDLVVEQPVELKVRWEPTYKMGVDAKGEPIAITADVAVDRPITIGSIMWRGRINDIPGTAYTPTSDLMKVIGFDEVPDVKGRTFRRGVSLARFSDSLPTVV